MNNLFWGPTISQPGGSFLYSKALFSIEEGYQVGNSTHYVTVGEFETDGFINNGLNNQILNLSLSSPNHRIRQNNLFFQQKLINHRVFYDDFDSDNSLNANWNVDAGTFGTTLGLLRVTTASVQDNRILINDTTNVADSRQIAKVRSSAAGNEFLIVFNHNDSRNYHSMVYSGNNCNFYIVKNGGASLIATASGATIPANTYRWMMVTVRQKRVRSYISSDGITYTPLIDNNKLGFESGNVGLQFANITGSTNTLDCDYYDFVEIGNQFIQKDVIKSTLGYAGVERVNIADEIGSFSGFQASSGSSWVVGSSSDLYLINTSSGNTWHTFMTNGLSYSDFVFEVEVKGSSGNIAGLVAGTTRVFYGNALKFKTGTPGSTDNSVENAVIGNKFTYNYRSEYLTLQPDAWYKLKMIKNSYSMYWYVNNILSNSIYGLTLSTTNGDNIKLGMFGYALGSAGTTMQFRNMSLSQLDGVVDDMIFEPNNNLSYMFDRNVPDSYATIWHQNNLDIFRIGSSRGSHIFDDSINKINISEEIDNNAGNALALYSGKDVATSSINENRKIQRQLDSSRYKFVSDQSLGDLGSIQQLSDTEFQLTNKDINGYNLDIKIHPLIELYDNVTLMDASLGVTKNLSVYNFTKEINFRNGIVRQTLTLG